VKALKSLEAMFQYASPRRPRRIVVNDREVVVVRTAFLISILILVSMLSSAVLASGVVVRWGGPGYDPASRDKNYSSLFSARADQASGAVSSHFQIWVDSDKTSQGVGSMTIRQQGHKDVVSIYCSKAQKHITAPYACRFKKSDFLSRAGIGELIVLDPSGRELLRTFADITRIKQVF